MTGQHIAACLIREGVHPKKAASIAAKRSGEKFKELEKGLYKKHNASNERRQEPPERKP
jgi:hypothetical protein